jgi:hypothetical protein
MVRAITLASPELSVIIGLIVERNGNGSAFCRLINYFPNTGTETVTQT